MSLDIRNIKTYVINLDKNMNKYKNIQNIFLPLGIYPERFSAIYGKDLNKNYINNITSPYVQYSIEKGRSLDCEIGTLGAIGCSLSHIKLWQMLINSDQDIFFILEDDAFLSSDYSINDINYYINNVNSLNIDWDIIYIGWYKIDPLKNQDILTSNNIYKVKSLLYCAHSYIINKKGALKLLQNAFPIIHQIDSYMSFMYMYRNVNAYRNKISYINQKNINGTDIQSDFSIKIHINRLSNKDILYIIYFFIFIITLIIVLTIIFIYKYISK
jgi:glycosyl transferase family 25